MKAKRLIPFILLSCALNTQAQERVIEMRADRMIIYPQRMILDEEETLGDILAMYPDLMQTGFNNLLEGYAVRIDNVAINSDNRVACGQIKAKTIKAIQICDNTGVAKGTTGLGRVIDINLMKKEDGLEGATGVEAGTDNLIEHHALARYGNDKTDIVALSTYAYQDMDSHYSNRQNLFAHMTNQLTDRDRLLTYFTQEYNHNNYPAASTFENEKCLARARYFHNFNDKGTELLLVGNYQYTRKAERNGRASDGFNIKPENDFVLYIAELNTPLTKHWGMMVGTEGDYTFTRYKALTATENGDVRNLCKYTESNNDLYLQLNYLAGPWRFTLGDRVMFYHYGTNGKKLNDTRNNFEASAIASIQGHSQIQAAYHRKFINPAFTVTNEVTDIDWIFIKHGLSPRYVDETKLGYTYSKQGLTFNLASYYQQIEQADDIWRVNASSYFKSGIVALTAGVNLYMQQGADNDYATFRLNPHVFLPHKMQINVNSIFATHNTSLPCGENVYMAVQLCKQWGRHWHTAVEWHDMFSSHYSAAMATVQYRL